jgi:hypothetical protein
MKRRTLSLALLVAALTAPVAALHAQESIRPEPIAADAPTAKQALALAKLLLAGDREKVDSYLKANGAESFTKSEGYAAAVSSILQDLKEGPRAVVGQDGFSSARGTGVGVQLAPDAGGQPTRAIVVWMDSAAPHRINGLRVASIQIG